MLEAGLQRARVEPVEMMRRKISVIITPSLETGKQASTVRHGSRDVSAVRQELAGKLQKLGQRYLMLQHLEECNDIETSTGAFVLGDELCER